LVLQSSFVAANVEKWRAFGALPAFHSLVLSADGSRVAMFRQEGDNTTLAVIEADTGKEISSKEISFYKARSASFLGNDHVLFLASFSQRMYNNRVAKFESTRAFVYHIDSGRIKMMLASKLIYPEQTGLGNVSGVDVEKRLLYMPAFSNTLTPQYHLYRVNFSTAHVRKHKRGNSDTIDWVVGNEGRVLARVDYVKAKRTLQIYSYLSGKKPTLVFDEQSALPDVQVLALAADERSVMLLSDKRQLIRQLDLETGSLGSSPYQRDGMMVSDVVRDKGRRVVAIVYKGMQRRYQLAAPSFSKQLAQVASQFPDALVDLLSVSDDHRRVLVKLSGPQLAPQYRLFDTGTEQLQVVGRQYPQLRPDDFGRVEAFNYNARDGALVSALFTHPVSESKSDEAPPLVVFVPGYAAALAEQGFDWWAQYLANQGYAVFKPYQRQPVEGDDASAIIGPLTMQQAIEDGVRQLIERGAVDTDRICIMGASIGGYTALRSSVMSSVAYRCTISVNGVTDLPASLQYTRRRYGKKHWLYRYWQTLMGSKAVEQHELKALSPLEQVATFKSPVLLIHANDDTVVPYRQGKRLYRALRKAEKEVEWLLLQDEDHWLSRAESRQLTLQTIGQFLQTHNPVQ
jgi:dipeptidyl aminopeptidase/acylaminoacyl peptidase